MTKILAIETSCDETAAAIIEDGRHIHSNVVATQIDLHRRFGGVFPEVASRQHVLSIQPVIEQALTEANVDKLSALDAIASWLFKDQYRPFRGGGGHRGLDESGAFAQT